MTWAKAQGAPDTNKSEKRTRGMNKSQNRLQPVLRSRVPQSQLRQSHLPPTPPPRPHWPPKSILGLERNVLSAKPPWGSPRSGLPQGQGKSTWHRYSVASVGVGDEHSNMKSTPLQLCNLKTPTSRSFFFFSYFGWGWGWHGSETCMPFITVKIKTQTGGRAEKRITQRRKK